MPTTDLNQATSTERGQSLKDLLLNIRRAIDNNLPREQWVRAEISKVDRHASSGHWYLELQQSDEAGSVAAQAKATIWKQIAGSVIANFREVTGDDLRKGIKILFRARVQFHEVYGLSLGIQEIDPAYTVGEFAAKLARIREPEASEARRVHPRRRLEPGILGRARGLSARGPPPGAGRTLRVRVHHGDVPGSDRPRVASRGTRPD